jgi:amino acid adenylation domain-containing protein
MSGAENPGVAEHLATLSPARRALLERGLMQRRRAAAGASRIPHREIEGPVPLSYAQELLWLISQVFDDGIAYNAPSAFKLEGSLDLGLLARAFDALIARHEILRTTYSVLDGTPMQLVPEPSQLEISVVDLCRLPVDEQELEAGRVLEKESRFAFDLETGPVMRPVVIRLSDDEHILMVNMHHVATDGYSRATIMHELTVFYEALVNGVAPALSPPGIQYADYAIWQRAWLTSGIASAQLEYWKRKLERAPSRLDLPTDFPRPPVRSYAGSHMRMMLDVNTREGLRQTARSHDATLFVALLAVFSTLLSRYSSQDDIVIGTPFGGRTRTELESVVGYFVNPLALRVDLSGDPTFNELVRRARETTVDAFAHADVPYEMVVRETNPERDLSQTPVFQAMIVYHDPGQTQRPNFEPEGIRCTEMMHDKNWSKFDVMLGCGHRAAGLNTTWEYSTELFKPETAQRMMNHFTMLAQSAAAHGGRRLSRLPMLTESERAQVLVSWNPQAEPLPEQGSVKELFEQQVARTPEAEAVVLGGERLTFAQLNGRANRIASLLRRQGVGPGKLVGILMDRSLELVPAVLGVIKAGGAYLPLDPTYPAGRLQFMLADARPDVLLTLQTPAGPPRSTDATVVLLDAPAALDGMSEENPSTVSGGDDLAYVIYTSGSTGQPKGVMITNRSLISVYFAYEREYRLRELHAHLQMASFSFDVFTGDVIRSLLVGAKLVLCPRDVVVDPARLYELMVTEGVDAAEFVPTVASLLFDYAEREHKTLRFMRFVAVGGEPWRNDRYTQFKRVLGPATRLVNSYGLTEATMDSTYFEPSAEAESLQGGLVPIGRPLPNTRVYVLDGSLEPQPIGIPGELCIGGDGVALGYLNRPELNAERFAPDPFADRPDQRMYRTGDLARWSADGTIQFIGRSDRQLKIRGFRIEPHEIESVLERHLRVRAAAVTDRDDPSGAPCLVAYVTPEQSTQPPLADDLRAFVAKHLPAYMIPAGWVLLDSLPTTPNEKVDLNALPDPKFDRCAQAGAFVAPRTTIERTLVEIWREVLGVDVIGINDNFFALAGHSLLAVRLFSKIEERLGVRLPLASLFQTATIAQLAGLVDRSRGSDQSQKWSSLVPMRSRGHRPPFFLVGWVGGQLIGYRTLVSSFPEGVPIYGLQAPGLDGRRLPIQTVEGLAAHYVQEMRRMQSEGPYYIGGFCFAGVVAYEMARQLAAQGEDLGMVALIDSYPRGTRPRPDKRESRRVRLAEFRVASARGRVQWVHDRVVRLRKRIGSAVYIQSGFLALEVLARAGLQPPRRPWNLVLVASIRASKRYTPVPSGLRVEYFRPQIGPSDDPTPWDRLAQGGVVLRPLIGPDINHETITNGTGVPRLVEELASALDEAMRT